jgi:hypothetical protein
MSKESRVSRTEDVTDALTRVIGAIDIVKNAVPLQLGQGILATTAAILVVVKVCVDSPRLIQESSD